MHRHYKYYILYVRVYGFQTVNLEAVAAFRHPGVLLLIHSELPLLRTATRT